MSGLSASPNAAWAEGAPRLSVLVPYFRYDPSPLLDRLAAEAARLPAGEVELVLLDDGGGDAALADAVDARLAALPFAALGLRLAANEGRAKGRNRLAAAARARHLLFLDCDMAPDAPDFLRRWLELVTTQDPPLAFGGFSMAQAPVEPATRLHRALQLRGECAPAAVRRRTPEKYVFTSNLLVRRDVFEGEAFDESFAGWGWEDVEWGLRVARRFGVRHIDNSATHLGLDTPDALAAKYEQSAANFARVVAKSRAVVESYPSYRLARGLKRLPALRLWRPWLKRLALSPLAPMIARIAALKAYRAALYAEVV